MDAVKPLLAAILLLLAIGSSAANFTTQTWHSKIEVAKDQSLTVTEEIGLTFTIPQHGLIRKMPFQSPSVDGNGRRVSYALVRTEIQLPGRQFETADSSVKTDGGDWVVRIGRADTNVSGQATYRITYKVFNSIRSFPATDPLGAHEELYFNAIPIGWSTDIERGSLEVTTPKPTEGQSRARIVAGPKGSRWGLELSLDKPPVGDPKLIQASFAPGLLRAEITRPIPMGYGATVILSMPEGTLDKVAAPAETDEPYFPETRGIASAREVKEWFTGGLMPFLLLPLLIIAALLLKPKPGPVVVQFEAPADIEASESGLLLDGRVDRQDIVAGIMQVALKGGFQIDVDERTGMKIEVRAKEKAKELSLFEQEVHRSISMYGTHVSAENLRGSFGTYMTLLTSRLKEAAGKKGWYGKSAPAKVWVLWIYVLGTIGLGLFFLDQSPCLAPLGTVASLVAGIAILNKILVWSQAGVDARSRILGLREFITRAQEKELDYMSRVNPSQALFETLLPYAVAFGAIKQWSQAFAGIELTQPTWYAGPDSGTNFDAIVFGSQFYDMNDTWGRSIATPAPTTYSSSSSSSDSSGLGGSWSSSSDSSGSWDSGGGFSGGGDTGGGSGGGGGDSW